MTHVSLIVLPQYSKAIARYGYYVVDTVSGGENPFEMFSDAFKVVNTMVRVKCEQIRG